MESIIARALEYTLKYWLRSFSRDQFKLQGRTAQLSNLDINGDALHASIGLPPAISVTTAKVGKLEIVLPSVSKVQVEPIVVQIDRLDLVLEENDYVDESKGSSRLSKTLSRKKSNTGKGSGYGFADKIADGMTLEVRTVNLLLETHGGMRHKGGASWASPMASITIHNLLLYTTNENWQVVNLKEARDFSSDNNLIYVFKKLEWESLSIDLLPHPDMFADAHVDGLGKGSTKKDEDGAKRVFFGGERFIEGISGEAHITIQRTELNSPLGLEVQLHITEAVCPAISEPGLRALLRFMTGFYVCLNRGDVTPNNKQSSTEAAKRSLVSIVVDHVFFCIKDSEFQLELLMQSLLFSRTSVSDGGKARHLNRIMIRGLFLRDTFSRPPCTLVQPMMSAALEDILSMPEFAENFCPPIYPLGEQDEEPNFGVPLLCLYSLQLKPSPAPPILASQSVIECQPLMIHIQEESCLRIASFLADGIVVNPRAVLPKFTINTLTFNLKGLDATVPLELGSPDSIVIGGKTTSNNSFVGARLLIEKLFYQESPGLSLRLLNLEKDPACFSLWENQPVDASMKKMKAGATLVSISLETSQSSTHIPSAPPLSSGLGRCVDLKDFCFEMAMASADGSPLLDVPPPGGVVRIGVAFQQFLSNTSVEQLFLILDLYSYLGKVSEKIAVIGKQNPLKEFRDEGSSGSMMDKVPGDTAINLAVKDIQLRFLESSSKDNIQGVPLVQFVGQDLFVKVSHRTLGGAMAISSDLTWERIEVDCADTTNLLQDNEGGNRYHQLRSVLWVHNKGVNSSSVKSTSSPLLVVNLVHVIPYNAQDMACHSLSVLMCITGVRLGGGMNYAEALLHRFGILGPDGGPGEGLMKGLEHLSAGPLSKLLKASPTIVEKIKENKIPEDEENNIRLKLGTPDDLDVCIELNDWLFALEGAQEEAQSWRFDNQEDAEREDRSWHTTFRSVCIKTKGGPKNLQDGELKSYESRKYPVDFITVGVVGLQILKPLAGKSFKPDGMLENGLTQSMESHSGVNFDVEIVTSENEMNDEMPKWVAENMKFSVKEPIEAVVTKDELEYLTILCKSEVDSMGRITAGILLLLKLESSIGPQGISQLSNLGSEGFDKIFSPQRLSRGSSAGSIGPSTASSVIDSGRSLGLSYTVSSLEEVMLEAQTKCAAISAALSTSTTCEGHLDDHVLDLRQKLASMQKLLQNLKSQI